MKKFRLPGLAVSSFALLAPLAFSTAMAATAMATSAPATAPAADLIQRGSYLAAAGDCIACHTAPKGKPFAGGLPMSTPMGAIYSTNITPDSSTGIGSYSEADFTRALREGVAKDGHNLYPAMPYPSFAKVNDDDMHALYTYFMNGVTPVNQANRDSAIPFPLNMRWPLKLWNMVFLKSGVYAQKPDHDAMWNRGAYLVQGLGHCGACHTPRGIAFQEKAQDETGELFLSGGVLDGWDASNLTGNHNSGLGRWSEAQLVTFLKTGANEHATAFGSMTSVVNNSTQALSDDDATAMARYLKSLPPALGGDAPQYAYADQGTAALLARPAGQTGARVYAEYCIHCHAVDGHGHTPFLAPLAGNPNVLDPSPSSLINVVLNGSDDLVIKGVPAPYPMPKFGAVLNDQQVADVTTFIRAAWNNNAPAVSSSEVAKLRKSTEAAR